MLAGALAIAYFAWFRDSSFVAVENVKVEGVSSTDRAHDHGRAHRRREGHDHA